MIEILCIAAEITAVLLILTIAIPTSASKSVATGSLGDDSLVDSKLLIDCEESLMALRSFAYLQASHSIASRSAEPTHTQAHIAVIHRLRDHLDAIEPLQVSTIIDSVTKLPNRLELERVLKAATQWKTSDDTALSNWVGLLQVDNLDQLDDEHGPMASELILRELAGFLRNRFGGFSPLVRFNHNSFAIALPDWSQEMALSNFESARADIEKLTATVGDSAIKTTASAAVAKLESAGALDSLWERLEDGIVEAIAAGANRGRWFDSTDDAWHPMGNESPSETNTTHQVLDGNHDDASDDAAGPSRQAQPSPSPEQPVARPITNESSSPRTDSSSNALGADDIASLFKAAQTNHRISSSGPDKSIVPTAVNSASKTVAAPGDSEKSEDPGETFRDDVAALFQAAAAKKVPSMERPSDSDSSKSKSNAETADTKDDILSPIKDDIESLFAAFKNNKQSPNAEVSTK